MFKTRFISMLVLLAAVATGAVAQTTYKVSVKEGTEDASNWQGKAGTGNYQSLPLEGVAAGTAVSVKYSGTKKVKSVKAKKKAEPDPTVTLTPGQIGYLGVKSDNKSNTVNGITIELTGGTSFYTDGLMDTHYGSGTFTFTSSVGRIKRIDINHNAGNWIGAGEGWTSNNYYVSGISTFTWSGTPAASVTLNGNGTQCMLLDVSSIVFTLEKQALIVNPEVGQVIGSDGKNYAAASVPDGVTKVAMIAYVSGSNGLAIALSDESTTMNWFTATTTAAGHTPVLTNGTWKLPSQDEWKNMFKAFGGNESSYSGLQTAITNAGGTALQYDKDYWSSTENANNTEQVLCMIIDREEDNAVYYKSLRMKNTTNVLVRPVLAF